MKIGIIVSHPYQFEGPFYQYVSANEKDQLEVLFTKFEYNDKIYDNELKEKRDWGIDLTSGYNWKVLPSKKWRKFIREYIEASHFDLVIINGYYTRQYLYTAYYLKKCGAPLALRLDTVNFNNKTILKRIYKHFLFAILKNLYDHFFVVGTLTKEYLLSLGIDEKRISFFSYVVDNDYFRTKSKLTIEEIRSIKDEYTIPYDYKVILCIAKFNYREAPTDLLQAYNAINKKQNICLLLVGDGEQRKELEAVASKNLYNKIIFTGYIPYPKLPKIYGISDLFVHPSYNEPWGVSVQEALASGLPVITSNMVGSSADLIINGRNGFIYNIGNINDLKEFIIVALKEEFKNKAKGYTDQILDRWNYKMTWDNIISVSNVLKNVSISK